MPNRYWIGTNTSWNDANNWTASDGDLRLATGSTVNRGVASSGTYENTQEDDGTYYVIDEVTGAPGYDVEITIGTLQDTPDTLYFNGYYDGHAGHTVHVDVYNHNTTSWDTLTTLVEADADEDHQWSIASDNYANSGIVTIRFYHVSPGNPLHKIHLDEIYITDASGGVGVPTNLDDVIFNGRNGYNCTCDVAIDINSFDMRGSGDSDGYYTGIFDLGDSNFTHAVADNVRFAAMNSGTVDFGDSNLAVGGDFTHQTTMVKGNSVVSFTGSADQNVYTDPNNDGVFQFGSIVVNKTSGVLTLQEDLYCDSFTGTSTGDGTFDPNSKTVIVTGSCVWQAGFDFASDADCMDGSVWNIGSNFLANGQTLNATSAWYLSVSGEATATGVGWVEYCDATGGSTIIAGYGPWESGVAVYNWDFEYIPPNGLLTQYELGLYTQLLHNPTLYSKHNVVPTLYVEQD